MRKQGGQVIRIGAFWYVRYWDRVNVGGVVQRRRLTHKLSPIVTRGKNPPADVISEADSFMGTVNGSVIAPNRVLFFSEFFEGVYLPWVKRNREPSTHKGYRGLWRDHLRTATMFEKMLLKNTRTFNVQNWIDEVGRKDLGRNTLKNLKSTISGAFRVAKNLGYYDGVNPADGTLVNPKARPPKETYAYGIDEVRVILSLLPEPAATIFAIAAFAGLRLSEIQGLQWPDYREAEFKDSEREITLRPALWVTRKVWNGIEGDVKTRNSKAPVPVIKQLMDRIEVHRLRCGNPTTGAMFPNSVGRPVALSSVVNRIILPTLNRCRQCQKSEQEHREQPVQFDHKYVRDASLPTWRGWHAARRGLATNLYHLGVPDKVIQAILRHGNVAVTLSYYVKPLDQDVCDGMDRLEREVNERRDTDGTVN
jgi:integrase